MPLHPAGRQYRNQVVKLPELAVVDDLLEDLTFENCQIIGPAVIIGLGDTEINSCTFEGPPEAFLWPISDDRVAAIGAIGLKNCRLYGCKLTRIGVVVKDADMEAARRAFGA